MRENNEDFVYKSAANNSINKSNRKRSRSNDSDDGANKKEKMKRMMIVEDDERANADDDGDEDILSFAKKTLEQDDVPDTEDILRDIPRALSGKFIQLAFINTAYFIQILMSDSLETLTNFGHSKFTLINILNTTFMD